MQPATIIREASPDEAPALLALAAEVDRRSPYTLLEPGERPTWHAGARPAEDLAAFQARDDGTILLAEIGGRPVGSLTASAGRLRRNHGVVTVMLGVLPEHQGHGVGTALLAAAEAWAAARSAHRLELTVAEPNVRAHALYRRLGFLDEGCLRDSLRIDGAFCDEYILAKGNAPARIPDWAPLLLEPAPAMLPGVAIRKAVPADAAAYFAYDRAVRSETPFLMRTVDEGLRDEHAARRFLAGQCLDPGRATILAVSAGGVAGSVSVWGGGTRRTAHEASLGMAVRRAGWAAGIGKRLLAAAEAWAKAGGFHRLSLWVLGHNVRARRFYAACGFTEEAVCRRYAVIDGRFADHVAMAKLFMPAGGRGQPMVPSSGTA